MRSDFVVAAGELLPFLLEWQPDGAPLDPLRALADTESYWSQRASRRPG